MSRLAERRITSYPRITLPDYAGERAERLRAALNIVRRQLSTTEKQAIIAAELRRDATQSDRDIERTFGFCHKTVGKVRRLGNFPSKTRSPSVLDSTLCGNDLVKQPTAILANTEREHKEALTIASVPQSCEGKLLPVKTVKRRAKRQTGRAERLKANPVEPVSIGDIALYHCRFQELDVGEATVDLIVTDPPFGGDFLAELPELAEFADRVLKPGGLLAMYYGHYFLPQAMNALAERLTYVWLGVSAWSRGDVMIGWLPGGGQVFTRQYPVLIYAKGTPPKSIRLTDLFLSTDTTREMDHHDWQKPVADVKHWLNALSKPGDLVVDTCLGGCTTAVACRELGRRFVGCDIDGKAIAIGRERLAKASAA